jgi:hypothetical protein
MAVKKLENPFTPQPEPNVKFWTAKSKAMKDFRDFFEVTCMRRTGPANIAVVGDVGSGKTRLFQYLKEKFKLDTSKIICYVNLHDVFNELKSKYFKEIDVRFLEIFYNKIFQQLESIYDSVLKEANSTEEQKKFAKRIITLITENKRKVIESRLKRLAVLRRMIEDKTKELESMNSSVAKEKLKEELETLQIAERELLREEIFTPKEFHSFLEIFLAKMNQELGVDIFTLYVDELERITEMERDYNLPLKSTAESDLRDHLLAEFGPKGLKIIVACTRKAWVNFTERFHSSFPPKEIPSLEREDLQEAIIEHLSRVRQEKFNPFTEPNAVNLIAYYSYRNFRTCMYILRYCYDEYVKRYEKGETDWKCTLRYVVENHFDKLIRFQLYNECIRMLERQFSPKYKRMLIEKWVHHILVQFEEFDYETLWKSFKYQMDNQQEFDSFITTLRNTGVISEIRPNEYIVMRENFAIEEPRRDPTDERFLTIFWEMAAGKNEADKVAYFHRLRSEGFDDLTITNRLKGLSDILQPTEDRVLMIGTPPGAIDTIKGIIRASPKIKVENEVEHFAPFIIKDVWGWEASKYKDHDNVWFVSLWYDPATSGAISRKVPGVVLFRDYRREKPSPEDALKNDIRYVANVLGKVRNLQFGLVICVWNAHPPLPTNFLRLPRVREEELQKIRDTPILWKRLFGIHEGVFGTENRVMKEGYDLTNEETKIKLSNLVFVLPVFGDSTFPEGSKLENEKIVDYVLARERILSVFRQSDVEEKFLKPALADIKNIILNPIYDKFLKDILDVIWEIDLPIKTVPDKSVWPQRPEKKKWIINENTLKILDSIVVEGLVKSDEENLQILKSLINTGFFNYHGAKEIEDINLKQDTTLNGKYVPKQFAAIFDVITDNPQDAADIFMKLLQEHTPFRSDVPEESLLIYDAEKLKAIDKTRSLIASVDVALYIMSKMFPEVLQDKREDGRFTYQLLKEVPKDPKKFLQSVEELDEIIKFLIEKRFELDKESQEIKELFSIGQAIKKKLDRALDNEAIQILAIQTESKLTKEKASAIQRLDQLHSKIWDRLTDIREAFLAYLIILEWQKNPYFEKWNPTKQSTEKMGLPPTPKEIKEFLERNLNAWVKEEEYSKEKVKKIIEIWETKIWSTLYDKIADDSEPITKLIDTINAGMKDLPNLSLVSEKMGKVPMKFNDYVAILKPIKNLKQIESTLRINLGYIKSYNEKMNTYNSKVVSLCYELMKMSRAELGKLTFIVSELTKIDACKKKAEEYQTTVRKGRPQFGEKFDYIMAKFARSEINEEEIKAKLYDLLKDLLLNWLYGSLVLYVFESDAKEEMIKTLSDSLKRTKFAKFRENLEKVKDFCEAYKVKFEKETWKKCEDRCTEKYDTFVKGYMDGIWQNQPTIPIEGQDIHNITQFEQLIDTLNDKIIRDIINSIPDKMDEPYSFILREIKDAYNKWKMEGKKEVFATILKLLNSPKITRQKLTPEQVLQFLEKVEKFGLLW